MEWFYATRGHPRGPVTEADLADLAAIGELSADTLVWSEGMAEWAPAASTPLSRLVTSGTSHNPYAPPRSTVELVTDGRPEPQDPLKVLLLCAVTLNLYAFYKLHRWSRDLNRMLGRSKYRTGWVLPVSILTFGLGYWIYGIRFAFDIDRLTSDRHTPGRTGFLGPLVVGIMCLTYAALLLPTVGRLTLASGLGFLLPVLIQAELNKLAEAPG